ncbi:insulin-like 3 [Nannospalax galili]|uniref:Insulin-like 3 n=1 Tax=Nannospalax galili TaxID=1026970 RepID=A0A8C6W7E9_NANGA|nr:insulin-like 3 [Nannospalax galili]
MHASLPAWMLLLLLPTLGFALRLEQPLEARDKLCGHHFVRALVRVCGGPRWSPEAAQRADGQDRELLQWLEGRHLLHALVADSDPTAVPDLQPGPQAPQHHRHHRATNPAHHCCLAGCTQQDLLGLCPH